MFECFCDSLLLNQRHILLQVFLESDERSVYDSFRRLQIDNTIVEAIKKHCNIHIPETCFFSLQRTDSLPKDYEIEPLTEEINISSNIHFLRYSLCFILRTKIQFQQKSTQNQIIFLCSSIVKYKNLILFSVSSILWINYVKLKKNIYFPQDLEKNPPINLRL